MIVSWIQTQIRGLFAGINYCIYSLIEWIMYGIFDIAALEINTGLLNDIYTRIYVFLGIFMLFKLTISFLKYMVDPDSLVDKEKGVGKLVSHTIVMLALLILLPQFFPLLREAQREFLPVLPRIILGQDTDNSDTVEDNAEAMTAAVLGAFYSPCSSCSEADKPDPITSIDDMMNTYGDRVNGQFAYDFNYVFSILAGIVMAFILLSITVKIGIRMFKMFILEMIAPVPIMSYIDPKAAKDGAFAAWVKQLVSTFLDIFVRLGVVYVVLMLMQALTEGRLFDSSTFPTDVTRNAYLMVFIVIALLMFAKDAPNFVKDALGIKHDKNPDATIARITGAGMGFVSGAISGRSLSGAITGAVHGAGAAYDAAISGKRDQSWRAGGDAALQARTADPHAKSGILASLQMQATKSQLAREASKLNLTDDTLSAAKQNMIDMQGLAAEAERNWQYGVQTGEFRDLQGNLLVSDENGTAMEKAQKIVAETSTASTIATKNYEKANKAGDAYKINRTFAEDLKKDKKEAKVDYRRGTKTKAQYKAKGRFDPQKGKMNVER